MKIKTNVKAGGLANNHNQTMVRSLAAKINRQTGALCLSLAFVFALTLALTRPAQAQLDPGVHDVFQNGIKTAEVFVPIYDPAATNYVEHWVLFSNYVYPGGPGADATLVTTIKQGRRHYESEADFFARVPWGAGFRYVRANCTTADRLPGR